MLYCLNPSCPNPSNPDGNIHCQYCGVRLALRNRFKALRMVGQGGFGKTYLAEDLDNRNKPCIIKRLTYQGPTPQATEKARQLFEQEAERLDHLIHPQIPRLIGYFQEEDYLYLIQEFIEGETLHSELHRLGCFDEDKVGEVLTRLLPVLDFVHSCSVIHRDIKPDNIIRRYDGELILIDFGVAKFLEQSGVQSATTIGTPGYAAPEQVQGRATPASDLFALGATCFQLLTKAFENDIVSKSGYGWVDNWQSYLSKNADSPLSTKTTAILTRLISLDEYRRYRTAADVLHDLVAEEKGQMSPSETIAPQKLLGNPGISEIETVAVSPLPSPNVPFGIVSSSSNKSASPPVPASAIPQPPSSLPPGARSASNSPPTVVSAKPQTQPATFSSLQQLGQAPASNSPAHQSPASRPAAQLAAKFSVPVSGGFWLKYGCLTYLGQTLGFFLAMIVTAAFMVMASIEFESQANSIMLLLYWMYWLVAGFVVGISQWLALKRWLPRALWWWPATVAGFWAIALARATGYTNLASSLVVGIAVGLAQWGAMRQQAPRSKWWVLWCVMTTAVLFRVIAPADIPQILGWLIIAPLLDGLFLTWILRRQQCQSTES